MTSETGTSAGAVGRAMGSAQTVCFKRSMPGEREERGCVL